MLMKILYVNYLLNSKVKMKDLKSVTFCSLELLVNISPLPTCLGTLSLLAVSLSHFSFLDFSLSFFKILTSNLVYELNMIQIKAKLNYHV